MQPPESLLRGHFLSLNWVKRSHLKDASSWAITAICTHFTLTKISHPSVKMLNLISTGVQVTHRVTGGKAGPGAVARGIAGGTGHGFIQSCMKFLYFNCTL